MIELPGAGPLPANAGEGAGGEIGVRAGAGAGAGWGITGDCIDSAPARATRRRNRSSRNNPASRASAPAKIASHKAHLAFPPGSIAAPCAAGLALLSARLGSDVGGGMVSSAGSADVRPAEGVGRSAPADTLSPPLMRWPGVARAAGVNRLVSDCGGGGVWMAGRGRWAAVGVGVGAARGVAITRGATGTGPSISTGPWTWGVAVGAGLGAGNSWKPAGGVAEIAGAAIAGIPAPASTSTLHCAIAIAIRKELRSGHIFQGWIRQNRAISQAALNRD